ncbi:SRPBCC family protein [Antribacter sp. KLBMP9083]|uniref:SRPBCC family protein n=1 Tax=Antribacter soli TaxID=2910976 RepID=A0AA41QJC2_9MICO|nr:SRPBCC family protein [Antribacter soli]MCF4123297.1 SRPBCC family protein [Antribacter soli]
MTGTPNLGVLRRLGVTPAGAPAGASDGGTAPRGASDGGAAPHAVRFERTYPTSAADLWDALTTPERVGRWLGTLTGDLRAGGDFHLDMSDASNGSEGDAAGTSAGPSAADQTADEDARNWGRVLECEPGRRLLLTWEATGQATSQVEVTTSAVGQRALLTLEHRGLPEASARGYGAGWHDFLDRLEGDLTGRPQADWATEFARYLAVYRGLPVD